MKRTRLLVSVRNAAEARDAVDGGADIIDVKEPHLGSLGAATITTVEAVIREVNGATPVTAACGELSEFCHVRSPSKGLMAAKFGLASMAENPAWHEIWKSAITSTAADYHVAVAYADFVAANAPTPELVVQHGNGLGCRFLLIDTFCKSFSLPELLTQDTELGTSLDDAVTLAKQCDMKVVIAGSLLASDFPAVVERWSPDLVAVRGAACTAERTSDICAKKVQSLTDALLGTPNTDDRGRSASS